MTDKMARDEVLARLERFNNSCNYDSKTDYSDMEEAIAGVDALVDEVEALRAKMAFLESRAIKNDAYDIYGGGAHWYIGIHTNDGRLTFGGVLDEAIARAKGGA